MGDTEGSYRVLQTPGTRLGVQFNAGISTLEPGQSLSGNTVSGTKSHGRGLQIRVQGLDDSQEFYDMDVSFKCCTAPPPLPSAPFINPDINTLFVTQQATCHLAVFGYPACVTCAGDSCQMALVLKSLLT